MSIESLPRNIFWADDDADTALQPVGRLLVRRGKFVLTIAEDYQAATRTLHAASQDGPNERFSAALIDTILPPGMKDAALGNYLGLKLAEVAASFGISIVVFLSVVPYGEITSDFERLSALYPRVSFSYFNKLLLFEGNHFADLLAQLSGSQ
jgi:hypothetical protein